MADQTTEQGMSLLRWCKSWEDLRNFVREAIQARVVRCISPERQSLCNEAATHVFWQDRAEWYPCCEAHRVKGGMWTGSTHFTPHTLDLIVIQDRAEAWLAGLSAEERAAIRVERYQREA